MICLLGLEIVIVNLSSVFGFVYLLKCFGYKHKYGCYLERLLNNCYTKIDITDHLVEE